MTPHRALLLPCFNELFNAIIAPIPIFPPSVLCKRWNGEIARCNNCPAKQREEIWATDQWWQVRHAGSMQGNSSQRRDGRTKAARILLWIIILAQSILTLRQSHHRYPCGCLKVHYLPGPLSLDIEAISDHTIKSVWRTFAPWVSGWILLSFQALIRRLWSPRLTPPWDHQAVLINSWG